MNLRYAAGCLVIGLLSSASAFADGVLLATPQSFYVGSAEEFVRIGGSGLAGTDATLATTVVFSGPAGSFTIDANTTTNAFLDVFVPTPVFSVAGAYTLTVIVHDTGGTTRQVGTADISIVDRPANTTPMLILPEVVIAEATSPSGAIVTYTQAR